MKVDARSVDRFLRTPDSQVWAALIFGPDRGLVRERGAALLTAWGAQVDDPFAFAALTEDDLKADPLRLDDELRALSLTGDQRAVRLRVTGDAGAAPVLAALEAAEEDRGVFAAKLVVEAGDLKKTSKLRKAVEASSGAAAIACYADTAQALERLADDWLAADGLSLTREARAALGPLIGGDRMLAKAQVEKLALYMLNADGAQITVEDVTAACVETTAAAVYDLAGAVASGDAAGADRLLHSALAAGASPVGLCRGLQRHFARLAAIHAKRETGAAQDRAIAMTGPPLFGPARDALLAQLRRWPADALERALSQTLSAERQLKTTGAADAAVLGRLVLALSRGPRRPA